MVDIGEIVLRIEYMVGEKKELAYTILNSNPGQACMGASVAVAVAEALQSVADMIRGEITADLESQS